MPRPSSRGEPEANRKASAADSGFPEESSAAESLRKAKGGISPTALAVITMPTCDDGSNEFSPYRILAEFSPYLYVRLTGEAAIQDNLGRERTQRLAFHVIVNLSRWKTCREAEEDSPMLNRPRRRLSQWLDLRRKPFEFREIGGGRECRRHQR
jgi:hypothetical protein